jgi:hypothetical protein
MTFDFKHLHSFQQDHLDVTRAKQMTRPDDCLRGPLRPQSTGDASTIWPNES